MNPTTYHEDEPKPKNRRAIRIPKSELECLECGKLFRHSLSGISDPQCPRCKGYDVEPTGR